MATTDQPIYVSTHSRPKAAGSGRFFLTPSLSVFQHTAARRRLANAQIDLLDEQKFQHTAARRRLVFTRLLLFLVWIVSTHSRPKAAGTVINPALIITNVSTHSRPKAAGNNE